VLEQYFLKLLQTGGIATQLLIYLEIDWCSSRADRIYRGPLKTKKLAVKIIVQHIVLL